MSCFRFFAAIIRKYKNTNIRQTLTLSYLSIFAFSDFRDEKANQRQIQANIRHLKCLVFSPVICRAFVFSHFMLFTFSLVYFFVSSYFIFFRLCRFFMFLHFRILSQKAKILLGVIQPPYIYESLFVFCCLPVFKLIKSSRPMSVSSAYILVYNFCIQMYFTFYMPERILSIIIMLYPLASVRPSVCQQFGFRSIT